MEGFVSHRASALAAVARAEALAQCLDEGVRFRLRSQFGRRALLALGSRLGRQGELFAPAKEDEYAALGDDGQVPFVGPLAYSLVGDPQEARCLSVGTRT